MYVKMYYANEDRNEFERGGIIDKVTAERFKAAREVAKMDFEADDNMLADLHDEDGNIIDVLCFSRQVRDRVVAALRLKN